MTSPITTTANDSYIPTDPTSPTHPSPSEIIPPKPDPALTEKLDWFNFETRMRALIKEMLDPCLSTQYLIEARLQSSDSKIEKLQDQTHEIEYQLTNFDTINKRLSEIEMRIISERETKDQDIEHIQGQILELDGKILTSHQMIDGQAQVLNTQTRQYEVLRKEQNILANRQLVVKEEMMEGVKENNKEILEEMGVLRNSFIDEVQKRVDFEQAVGRYKEVLEKFSCDLVEVESMVKGVEEGVEKVKGEKTGKEDFERLDGKVQRRVDQCEMRNIKCRKDVDYMESYIKSLAFSVGGNEETGINPYALCKYNYVIKGINVLEKEIKYWQKTRDPLFEIVKQELPEFNSEISKINSTKKRRNSLLISPNPPHLPSSPRSKSLNSFLESHQKDLYLKKLSSLSNPSPNPLHPPQAHVHPNPMHSSAFGSFLDGGSQLGSEASNDLSSNPKTQYNTGFSSNYLNARQPSRGQLGSASSHTSKRVKAGHGSRRESRRGSVMRKLKEMQDMKSEVEVVKEVEKNELSESEGNSQNDSKVKEGKGVRREVENVPIQVQEMDENELKKSAEGGPIIDKKEEVQNSDQEMKEVPEKEEIKKEVRIEVNEPEEEASEISHSKQGSPKISTAKKISSKSITSPIDNTDSKLPSQPLKKLKTIKTKKSKKSPKKTIKSKNIKTPSNPPQTPPSPSQTSHLPETSPNESLLPPSDSPQPPTPRSPLTTKKVKSLITSHLKSCSYLTPSKLTPLLTPHLSTLSTSIYETIDTEIKALEQDLLDSFQDSLEQIKNDVFVQIEALKERLGHSERSLEDVEGVVRKNRKEQSQKVIEVRDGLRKEIDKGIKGVTGVVDGQNEKLEKIRATLGKEIKKINQKLDINNDLSEAMEKRSKRQKSDAELGIKGMEAKVQKVKEGLTNLHQFENRQARVLLRILEGIKLTNKWNLHEEISKRRQERELPPIYKGNEELPEEVEECPPIEYNEISLTKKQVYKVCDNLVADCDKFLGKGEEHKGFEFLDESEENFEMKEDLFKLLDLDMQAEAFQSAIDKIDNASVGNSIVFTRRRSSSRRKRAMMNSFRRSNNKSVDLMSNIKSVPYENLKVTGSPSIPHLKLKNKRDIFKERDSVNKSFMQGANNDLSIQGKLPKV